MLDRFLSARQAWQVRRILRNGKLTLLCLVLTVVVLRGNLGAGRFGTPEKDLKDISDTLSFYRKRTEPRRVLEEAEQVNLTVGDDVNATDSGSGVGPEDSRSYKEFDLSKIVVDQDDGEPEFKRDPNEPYSLGPKITDWDAQRAEWLKNNPDFPNFFGPNKPRVLLVTGSSPKPCENPIGDHYLLKSIKNKIDYCRVHGIEIFYNMALLDPEMSGFWAKLPLLRKLLLSHPEVEFLWWMDSDAMFTDMAFEVPWERYKDSNLVLHGWGHEVYEKKNWIGLNTGSFLLRNTQWSLDLLDALAPMGPKGKVRDDAGALLTSELKGRPVFEADDQSAMVYLLATQQEKWADKVHLENLYFLHGYWGILVDRYEEMIDNFHPGFGDHRWPLVTHFVGCKPCSKIGDYKVGRCVKQMDRAFNFGDNQILQMYGFTHTTLESRRVKRIRNETSAPLEIRDELGLLHPSFRAVKV
nr:xyloglucan 6-xylosyltransferase 2-like [Ipomoea trifida]GMD61860.1 xyloglucan 6-xylosyltransferase 2 [Ipomoea batatas]GMD74234.1 xyloglucan 6-xylosyltransferase 2 [Ipomoea batatas]GMD75970.1 xyloglucan 6-xylosyltransferase 2 [Ipomoea batatas]GMD77786.1 xyloglucan 6-xylosyltransferase 2 [Ipomoea batatas]